MSRRMTSKQAGGLELSNVKVPNLEHSTKIGATPKLDKIGCFEFSFLSKFFLCKNYQHKNQLVYEGFSGCSKLGSFTVPF